MNLFSVDVLAIAKRHAIAMRTRVQFGRIGLIGQNVMSHVIMEHSIATKETVMGALDSRQRLATLE